ncbi:serine hydrolase domain-containing protein [Algoriphagus sp. CAU 1675]|uniref:serine hydrolase domain-containing protein n=1 Tax=Algoriphagus sp. CAU 1675 TaxID=3032597 RepID=UPI0023DC10D4|nr:serine hydrolase domain-containing protein [Algoriphagus sp. CAU 1675]MDF2157109.1 serine hydrolase [Algoriphagus sp. CAU 1675]
MKTQKQTRNAFTFCMLIALLLLSQLSLKAQTLETKIDSLLTKMFETEGPGAVFMVAKDGKPIYRKAFGMANLELEVPMVPENIFQIGSMTKQFTAVGILMLEEDGKLDIEDDVRKYIPDFPVQGDQLTIQQLMNHTSGIKDFTRMKSIMSIARNDLSPKEIVDFFKDEPVDFLPGEKFEYNNSGYVVLGYVIELVSGMSYEDFVEQRIFQKLGMNDSRYASDRELVKNRAYGYHDRGGYTNKMWVSLNIPFASGSLMSTVDDLLIWQNALNSEKLLKQETIRKAFTPGTLSNGETLTYGYGWHIKELGGMPIREHGGSVFGFKSMGVYLPEQDIYVVGLSNCDCNSPTVITREIAKLAIESL